VTSRGRRYGRLMPSRSPPVTCWICRRVPAGGGAARNAKSRFWFCECTHPVATVIFLTTHAPCGCRPLWYPGANSMLLARPAEKREAAAVMTRFSWALSTTLAVQKCTALPVVKKRAPTVGTPLNCLAVGIPRGVLTAGPALTAFSAGAAAAIRDGDVRVRA